MRHGTTTRALPVWQRLGIAAALALPAATLAFTGTERPLPQEVDVRGFDGVPRGLPDSRAAATQRKALQQLEERIGSPVKVEYNALTATPRHLFSYGAYLTPPRNAAPERIARDFLREHRAIYRFSDEDLENLRVRSRATLPDTGTTILVLQQHAGGLPVYQGEVLLTVSRTGQVVSAGNASFPQLSISNDWRIGPEEAITIAASGLDMHGLFAHYAGTRPELRTYGDLAPEFDEWPVYSGGLFGGEIVVKSIVFPLGSTARLAYEFVLETPHHYGMMWHNVVDAQTGQVLRRVSMTSFQQGGGIGVGRRATFRPDVQDMVEGWNAPRTASGKVFDTYSTILSGILGEGRSTVSGVAPNLVYRQPIYAAENRTDANGRGFKFAQLVGRNESGLPFDNPVVPETFSADVLTQKLGQVDRGFPDALNPSTGSPFGWFYLPTGNGGAEIGTGDANRAATRAYGYAMATEAKNRNLALNSPGGNGDQPYSATVTALPGSVVLADGRTLSSVIQSNYSEGNNVISTDDHANDNESTHGVKSYSATRQFQASYFDFVNSYEYGNVDAGGTPFFPPSTHPDVYPMTTSLFFLSNIIHDYLYDLGFTESLWNFQQDNFGLGGAANDGVSTQAMDGSGTNNANFSTPADGARPRMQMFLWTEAGVRRADGDVDFDVVAHEYYHGVSNRSAAKGGTLCLGVTLVGESGGQGEGWSDYIANSMTDSDTTGEYVTGRLDRGIRALPHTNYRWSYQAINRRAMHRRDQQVPDAYTTVCNVQGNPTCAASSLFPVHNVGEVWAATLWDMRELLIMRDPAGVFYDGNNRRLGSGTSFYNGYRQLRSVDARHPIDYRASFKTSHDPLTGGDGTTPNVIGAEHFIRPGLVAAEIAARGDREGPLTTALTTGARMADKLVLRGLQLSPCNPSFVDSRDSILIADRELNGGENRAIIWRAFASHGVGVNAESTGGAGGDPASQSAPAVVEDFNVPAGVTACETQGPLPPPAFALTNTIENTVTVSINGGTPIAGANSYTISRSASAEGPFVTVATIPAATTSYNDDDGGNGLPVGSTFYYKVRAARDALADCVSASTLASITVTVGVVRAIAPTFAGLDQVGNPQQCDRLLLSWLPANSTSPTANLVYDIHRVTSVAPGDGTSEPAFTPSAANRVHQGVTGTSLVDRSLTLNQPYYYVVRARDLDNGKIDSNDAGNTIVKFNAPTSPNVSGTPVFALETFESASANNRFTPPLREKTSRDEGDPAWQRVPGLDLGGGPENTAMYAPDFDPGTCTPVFSGCGAESDFSTVIGPLTLNANSILEFDGLINAEANFDGGVVELALGAPSFNSTPFPDNSTTFDLGNYMIAGGYNGAFTGTGSTLLGRRGFTGVRGVTHTRIVLRDFAPGGLRNAASAPVYIRFRMTSDAATANGPGSGWIIDNLVINTQLPCAVNVEPTAVAGPDFSMNEATEARLNGLGSSDVNGDTLTYSWAQIGDGPVATINGANTPTPTITAPGVDGDVKLEFRLTVRDREDPEDPDGLSTTDDVMVTVHDVIAQPETEQLTENTSVGTWSPWSIAVLALLGLRRRKSRLERTRRAHGTSLR